MRSAALERHPRWRLAPPASEGWCAALRRLERRAALRAAARRHGAGIAAGDNHTLALTAAGQLHSWGSNDAGRLGHGDQDGDEEDQPLPKLVVALQGRRVVGVSTYYHSLAVTEDGELFSWGRGQYGKLGNGSKKRRRVPKRVKGVEHVVRVATGTKHSVVLTSEGNLYAFGKGNKLGLGAGHSNQLTPKRVPLDERVVDVDSSVALGLNLGHRLLSRCADGHRTTTALGTYALSERRDLQLIEEKKQLVRFRLMEREIIDAFCNRHIVLQDDEFAADARILSIGDQGFTALRLLDLLGMG